jgi:hypothetical protein
MSEAPSQPRSGPEVAPGHSGVPVLTPLARQYLDQTRPWVRFMAIVTFVGAGLTALLAAVILVAVVLSGGLGREGNAPASQGGALGAVLAALVYLATACLYVALGLFLSRYAAAIHRLQATGAEADLEDALKSQKSFWRFVGICTVVGLVIGAIGLALAILAGALGAVTAPT